MLKNKVIIIANGSIKNKRQLKCYFKDVDKIICADGGANYCQFLKVVPDYLVGDFDSIKKTVLSQLRKNKKTEIIFAPDQNKTDLEKSLEFAEQLRPTELIILGALGDRFDHALANILCLQKIDKKIKTVIVDEINEIQLVNKNLIIQGQKNDVVSVIPLTVVEGLDYQGLKWGMKDQTKIAGWSGVSNRLKNKQGQVSVKKGQVLVIKIKR